MKNALLEVNDLHVHFFTNKGVAKALDGVSFQVGNGETLAIVGESGCGKSMTAHSLLGLVPYPGKIVKGEIRVNGENLVGKKEAELCKIRGNNVAMIFQEPMTSLNPVYTVGKQIAESIRLHQGLSKKKASEKAVEMLKLVGISSPETRIAEYPHQLSGGMRQRVMIAMALSCEPKLLVADEPTTALDVTIQAQILSLLRSIQSKLKMATLLITHDLGVVAQMADRVAVMYLGKIVEEGTVREVFHYPQHPYTKGLLQSIPSLTAKKKRLYQIDGTVPSALNIPSGCSFHTRCPNVMEMCRFKQPMSRIVSGHQVACWQSKNAGEEVSV